MSKKTEAAMRNVFACLALASTFAFATGTLASAQWREVKPEEEPALFRSDVNIVRVDAEVLLGLRAVQGLKQDDFRVFDNGAPREILNFSHEKAPLDLMLVFDVSGSMRPVVERVAESAQQALAQLREGDRVGVMYFTTGSRVVQPLTADVDRAVMAIDRQVLTQPFQGGTHLHDAIADAAMEFMREKAGDRRRAIVVITDNKGQRTRSDDSVIRLLWEADATATGLIVDSPDQMMGPGGRGGGGSIPFPIPSRRGGWQLPPGMGGGPVLVGGMVAGMNKVAEQSGGDIISTTDPGPAFAALVERLRNRYTLYYSMPEGTPGEKRQVRVELAGNGAARYPGAEIKARKGYMIPDGTSGRGTQVSRAPR